MLLDVDQLRETGGIQGLNSLPEMESNAGRDAVDYSVKPLGKVCSATGAPLTPGTVCQSTLVDQNGQVQRLDFRHDAWPGPGPHQIASWKTIVPPPANPDSVHLTTEKLFAILEDPTLVSREEESESIESLKYVSSLFLLQRRKLKLDDTWKVGDTEILRLLGSRGEGPFELMNLRLSEEEIHRLIQVLKSRLMEEGSGV